jgi:hypothetical protein
MDGQPDYENDTILDASTRELLGALRAQGDQTGRDAAALIEWLIDNMATYRHALSEATKGEVMVVREDADELGAAYFHPDWIGRVVRVVDTGQRAQA